MICPKCFSEIPDETKVCPDCGAELVAAEAEETVADEAAETVEAVEAVEIEETLDPEVEKKAKTTKIMGIVGFALSCVPILNEIISLIPFIGLPIASVISPLVGPSRIIGLIASLLGFFTGKKYAHTKDGKLGRKLSLFGLIATAAYFVYGLILSALATLFVGGFLLLYVAFIVVIIMMEVA